MSSSTAGGDVLASVESRHWTTAELLLGPSPLTPYLARCIEACQR